MEGRAEVTVDLCPQGRHRTMRRGIQLRGVKLLTLTVRAYWRSFFVVTLEVGVRHKPSPLAKRPLELVIILGLDLGLL